MHQVQGGYRILERGGGGGGGGNRVTVNYQNVLQLCTCAQRFFSPLYEVWGWSKRRTPRIPPPWIPPYKDEGLVTKREGGGGSTKLEGGGGPMSSPYKMLKWGHKMF